MVYGGGFTAQQRLDIVRDLIRYHRERCAVPGGHQDEWAIETYADECCALGFGHPGAREGQGIYAVGPEGDSRVLLCGEAFARGDTGSLAPLPPSKVWELAEDGAGSFACGLSGTYLVLVRDAVRDRVLLTNDRIGYLAHYVGRGADGLFILAPDATSVSRAPGIGDDISATALRDLLHLGFVLETDTLLNAVKVVPPAVSWTIGPEGEAQRRYWRYEWRPGNTVGPNFAHEVAVGLTDAVAHCLPSRGEVLLPLSGGLDSRFIACALHELGVTFRAVTIGDETDCDVRFARRVAHELGVEHSVVAPQYRNAWELVRWIALSNDGLHDPFREFCAAHVSASNLTPGARVLMGFFGETLCGSDVRPHHWVARSEAAADLLLARYLRSPAEFVEACTPAVETQTADTFVQRVKELLADAPGETAYARQAWFEFEQEQRKGTLYHNRLISRQTSVRAPFLWAPLMDLLLRAPLPALFMRAACRRALCEFWPDGRTIPWAFADLPPTAPTWRLLLRRVGKPGRLPRVVQSAWRRLFWCPDHPGHRSPDEVHLLDLTLPGFDRFLFAEGGVEAPYLAPDAVRRVIADYRAGRRALAPLISHLAAYTTWYASLR